MVRFALDLPNMAEPDDLVALGTTADRAGWDGVFLWDHVFGGPAFPVPMADPWVVLGALATTTERVRLGTAVTPVARRRPQKLARETVTVDRLSGGRLTLGVGLGSPDDEFTAFGEPGGRPPDVGPPGSTRGSTSWTACGRARRYAIAGRTTRRTACSSCHHRRRSPASRCGRRARCPTRRRWPGPPAGTA